MRRTFGDGACPAACAAFNPAAAAAAAATSLQMQPQAAATVAVLGCAVWAVAAAQLGMLALLLRQGGSLEKPDGRPEEPDENIELEDSTAAEQDIIFWAAISNELLKRFHPSYSGGAVLQCVDSVSSNLAMLLSVHAQGLSPFNRSNTSTSWNDLAARLHQGILAVTAAVSLLFLRFVCRRNSCLHCRLPGECSNFWENAAAVGVTQLSCRALQDMPAPLPCLPPSTPATRCARVVLALCVLCTG